MLHWAPLPFNAAPDYAFWLLQREQWASLVVLVDQHKVNNGRCKSLCKSPIMTSISSSSMMIIIIIIKSGIDVMRSYWGRMSRPRRAMLQNNLHGHSNAWIYERSGKYVKGGGGNSPPKAMKVGTGKKFASWQCCFWYIGLPPSRCRRCSFFPSPKLTQ